MKRLSFGDTRSVLALLSATFSAACGPEDELPKLMEQAPSAHAQVGVPQVDPRLSAIGSIRDHLTYPPYQAMHRCTGVLVNERSVLTSRECADGVDRQLRGALGNVTFAFPFGPSGAIRQVDVIAAEYSPRERGYKEAVPSLGVVHLREPVTDVPPAQVALSDELEVGETYSWVGHAAGLQEEGVRVSGESRVTERSGVMNELVFGSYEKFFESVNHTTFPTDCDSPKPASQYNCSTLQSLRQRYAAYRLEHADEVLVDTNDPILRERGRDPKQCADGGAPLFRLTPEGLRVFAVNQESFSVDGFWKQCDLGALYATLGPMLEARLARTASFRDPCEGLPKAGRCDGNVARRCSRRDELNRRVESMDCSLLGLTCGEGVTGEVGCDVSHPAQPPTVETEAQTEDACGAVPATLVADSTARRTNSHGFAEFSVPPPNQLLSLKTKLRVPPKSPTGSGLTKLWPGVLPNGGANFEPRGRGILQPALHWTYTCLPVSTLRADSWWVFPGYMQAMPSIQASVQCAGERMKVSPNDLLDIEIAQAGAVWKQTVTDLSNGQRIEHETNMLGQEQGRASFYAEALYGSRILTDVVFTETVLTFASPLASPCAPATQGASDFVSRSRLSPDGLKCCIDRITLRTAGHAPTTQP